MKTAQRTWLEELQSLVTNRLEPDTLRECRLAAILGDVPSTYAKSPRLWNAAFQALEAPARYVPLDIPPDRLERVVQALRAGEMFLGGSVTVPYKSTIIPLLDAVDPSAQRIGAVNVIVRTASGQLIGYNTDGLGGVRALTESVVPGQPALLRELRGLRVLLIGAGGAAQALAVFLWDRLGDGQFLVANRSFQSAQTLVQRLQAMRAGRVQAITEDALTGHVPAVDVVINATVKGQAGIRKLADGSWTSLEPYSALAPAHPSVIASPASEDAFRQAWYHASLDDIRRNQETSLGLCARLPSSTACYDIIYAPLESAFLRHARWSGHATLNGKAMNIVQAVEAFVRYVCRDWLTQLGIDADKAYGTVTQAMTEQWGH